MKWLACLAILACSWPSTAHACDTVATATPESSCVVLQREGVPGVWFSLGEADRLRKAHLELPELRLQIDKYEGLRDVQDYRIKAYVEVIALKDASLKSAVGNMDAFARRTRKAEEALDAWYRSPILWTGIGAGLVTGLVLALDR